MSDKDTVAVPPARVRRFRLTRWEGDPPAEGEAKEPIDVIEGVVDESGAVTLLRAGEPM